MPPFPRLSTMPRVLLGLLALILLVYLVVCAVLFMQQRSLLYFPHAQSPAGRPDTLTMAVDGTPVYVSVHEAAGPGAVIYLGGNADNAATSLSLLAANFPGRAAYGLHYRSFGGSPGQPSESALVADAHALFDQVHARHPDVVVIGRSLGSGIAVQLASRRPVSRLVLITPYDSLLDLARQQYPYVPVRWLLQDRYESWRYAPQVKAPTLVIAAEHDEVIPRLSTTTLVSRFAAGRVRMALVAGTGHNTLFDSPRFHELLRTMP